MKKATFGFIAAALMIAPSAAFAQDGTNTQVLNQNNNVSGINNSSSQRAQQSSIQTQSRSGSACRTGAQRADNVQAINQNADVFGIGNQSSQDAVQRNTQRQSAAAKRSHYSRYYGGC